MSLSLIVIDKKQDWEPYSPSENVLTFEEYLDYQALPNQRVRVINLCRDYSYLSEGYYCSLLSEARGQSAIPPSRVLNDIDNPLLYQLRFSELLPTLQRVFRKEPPPENLTFKSYFGRVKQDGVKRLARVLFEQFPCPIIQFTLKNNDGWEVVDLQLVSHNDLNDDEQTAFADALELFSRNVWSEKKVKKASRYDMAILVNEEEALPPSDFTAIKKFMVAGRLLGMNVELISPRDYMRLPEYDALFIRETTAIDHHTYQFAKKAEAEGLVVMDDSKSILLCTNKVFLADLFRTNNVPCPKTIILRRGHPELLEQAVRELGLPLVVKVPDGSFSRGMVKIESAEEIQEKCATLFEKSSLLLAQEFLYTTFDWRIGILNNKPLFACRYYMVRNHWQIYRHSENKKATSGGFDTLPTFEVPRIVLDAAVKATRPIGNGFYGVDVKESNGKAYVIEVNDNPSLDSSVEDKYLGKELYLIIMQEFIRRIELRRNG